ncbi:MAG TPA: YitT family protein [Candidatus Anaerotruncus excrementipullorum]|uniref:YitT family protein n=1 Tax=Candidatus Anaerotruncus excrementipullorum TaxID=2838465 RepID=A0A9D2B6K5_9FIRM|nr:YitT family protein [Candidatus Anaerotruncus excrementipullorum]
MTKQHEPLLPRSEWKRVALGMVGFVIYASGMNLFIVPLGLYSGGFTGIAQLLRTLVETLGLRFPGVDLAGVIYWMINAPMILLAYKAINRTYLVKMLIGVSATSVLLALIPVPAQPLVEEPLTGCLLGGIIGGFGVGTYLKAGCSSGGSEVLGILFSRKHPNLSVGKFNLTVNIGVFGTCLLLFDPTVTIYSVISSVVTNLMTDRVHSQNINVEAIIISKVGNQEIEQRIMAELGRGITYWTAKGGYTGEDVDVLYTVCSKYEVAHLRRIVHDINPQAFMVVKEGLSIRGNFTRKLH